jgi:hypothetical protein
LKARIYNRRRVLPSGPRGTACATPEGRRRGAAWSACRELCVCTQSNSVTSTTSDPTLAYAELKQGVRARQRVGDGMPKRPTRTNRWLTADDGCGPHFHRRYTARIHENGLRLEQLMQELQSDLNRASPTKFAHFQLVHDERGRLPWETPLAAAETPTGANWFRATHNQPRRIRCLAAVHDVGVR